MSIQSIGVIGAGAWGTALAILAARAGRRVQLWVRRPELAQRAIADRENRDYLPGVALDSAIAITTDLAEALAADAVLYAQPAQHFRSFCQSARAALPSRTPLVLCAKGIETGSGLLLHDVARAELAHANLLVLSGPSFAAEAAAGSPTAVAIAGDDPGVVEALMAALAHDNFRPYGSTDPIGVEVAGAIKNVMAIACGIVSGRGLGENARSALITRGLAEIARLVQAMGGRSETTMGLAGLGDLVLTCSSIKSRNMSLGYELGRGRKLSDILAERRTIAEGVPTAAAAAALAAREGIEMPIASAVDRVLKSPDRLDAEIRSLLTRPLKHEA